MALVCDRSTELILDVWLWPLTLLSCVLKPLTFMLGSIADDVEAAIKEQAIEHNL
jgi:hypothetical protein